MWIAATVTAEEARGVLERFLPVTIRLDDTPGSERFVVIEAPDDVRLVEARGLRVTCPGRVSWSLPVGALEMRIKKAQALLVPSVIKRGDHGTLRFHVEIEDIDFEWVPGLLDEGIAKVIEKKLGAEPIEWRFTETLTKTIPLPTSVEPARSIEISVREPSCAVTELAMSFVLYVAATPNPSTSEE